MYLHLGTYKVRKQNAKTFMGGSALDICGNCGNVTYMENGRTNCRQFTEDRYHHWITICKNYKPTNMYV